jgi:signal transduction histidine kinase
MSIMELKAASSGITHIIQSQEAEIKRVALELHEGIAQNLYSLYTGLQIIEAGIEQSHLKNYIKEMSHLMELTMQEVKLLTVELHPPTLTTLGLFPALTSYIKLFTSTFGILVDIESAGIEQVIPEQKSVAVFRVFQEALMNIAKYADTSNIHVCLISEKNSVKIKIQDFGKGFELNEDLINTCFTGIAAMKERMLLVGGECYIRSKVGEGTTVVILLPNKEEEEYFD